jgi:hypothetical protein
MQEHQRVSSVSLSHLPIVLFNLDNQKPDSEMNSDTSRRVSSASTSSSLPRTPSSAHGDLNDHLWNDSGRLGSLREAFSNSDYGSEDSHTIPATHGSGMNLSPGTSVLFRDSLERSGWNVECKSPVRSLSVLSSTSERLGHRLTRSATTSGSSVRLWPSLPPQAQGREGQLQEELASLRDEGDDQGGSDESKTDEENSDAAGSQPPSEPEDGALRRRRHIRRPKRAKQEQPRRLPPLPSSNALVHSHSTAARYISVPFDTDPTATVLGNTFSSTTEDSFTCPSGAGDSRRRSHTISDLPANRVRPLPSLNTKPNRTVRKVAAIPPLRITTLSLRSSPSEAEAVLTKTPNRRFNPLGSNFVPPPMPQDAGTRIDWELIEDILEVDGEIAETPIAIPREP